MKDLIADLEAAEAGSRALSDRVLEVCGWTQEAGPEGSWYGWKRWINPTDGSKYKSNDAPDPTRSIDDAVALRPRDATGHPMCIQLEMYANGKGNCCIHPFIGDPIWTGVQATPILALNIAILKAKADG